MRVPYDTDDGFDSRTGGANNWHVAQMVEPAAVNGVVAGSIPAVPATPESEMTTYHHWVVHILLLLWCTGPT